MKKLVRNIICGIDDNYYQHCAVMLISLLKNTKGSFAIYVFSLGVSDKHKNRLKEAIRNFDSELYFVDIDDSMVGQFPIRRTDYLSLATYLRLFIPQLLPLEISKVLYVDSDIVFNGDISELYDTDISDYSLLAIEDAPNEHHSRLGFPASDLYFNAGFILMNLDYLRKVNFTNRALEYIRENYSIIYLHDQDVLNALLHGTVLLTDIKWNMLDCFYKTPPFISEKYKKDLDLACQAPVVIHFSGPLKPWHWGCPHPLRKVYYAYSKDLPFRAQPRSYFYVFKKFKLMVAFFIFCGITPDKAEYLYKRYKSFFNK